LHDRPDKGDLSIDYIKALTVEGMISLAPTLSAQMCAVFDGEMFIWIDMCALICHASDVCNMYICIRYGPFDCEILVRVYLCVCLCVYIHIHVNIYLNMYVYLYVYICICL